MKRLTVNRNVRMKHKDEKNSIYHILLRTISNILFFLSHTPTFAFQPHVQYGRRSFGLRISVTINWHLILNRDTFQSKTKRLRAFFLKHCENYATQV